MCLLGYLVIFWPVRKKDGTSGIRGRDKRYASPMSKKPPRSKVSVEFEGKKYSATYYTTGRMVIVESAYGNEGMQRGGSKPEDVARMLLIQLLRAGKSR